MLVCSNCNSKQESGKFCGVCGGMLEQAAGNTNTANTQESPVNTGYQQAAAAETAGAHQQPNQAAENIKSGLSNYWSYFINLLKNPTTALHTNEGQLLNSGITLLIFALASSLSVYFLANSMADSMFGGMMSSSVPFFSLTFQLLLTSIVFSAVAFVSTLIMTKAAKNPDSAKTLLTQFGSIAAPFAAINLIAILLGLGGFTILTLLLLGVSYSLFLFIVPALFVYEKSNMVSNSGHKVYLGLTTVLITAVLTLFATGMFLSKVINRIEEMIGFFPF